MAHPYLRLLRDRDVRTLWTGLALSALGGELYRVGAIWLAVSLARERGAFLPAAQSAAILLTSLLAGAFTETAPSRTVLVGADLVRALFSGAVVLAALGSGLTLSVLLLASVVLAAGGALFNPVLQSSLPQIAGDLEDLRTINGLFDATSRAAQVVGPFLAAALMTVLPPIHLLSLNAVSFLASAGAILMTSRRWRDDGRSRGASPPVLGRLLRGVRAADACPGAWAILIATAVRAGAYALGFTVGVPLLFARTTPSQAGLAGVAWVFAAAAAGELAGNFAITAFRPRRPWRVLFLGYAMIGAGVALLGPAQLLGPTLRVAAMTSVGLAIGFGGGFAGVHMLGFFATRLQPDDFGAVLRLRLTLVTVAAMATTALGPPILSVIGPAATAVACGLIALLTAGACSVLGGKPRAAG